MSEVMKVEVEQCQSMPKTGLSISSESSEVFDSSKAGLELEYKVFCFQA